MKFTRNFTPNQWKWIVLGLCDILLGVAVLIIRDDPIGMRGAEYLMVMLVLLSYEPDRRGNLGPFHPRVARQYEPEKTRKSSTLLRSLVREHSE